VTLEPIVYGPGVEESIDLTTVTSAYWGVMRTEFELPDVEPVEDGMLWVNVAVLVTGEVVSTVTGTDKLSEPPEAASEVIVQVMS
jgi:hypothetical protein